jgi:hypothetical protein
MKARERLANIATTERRAVYLRIHQMQWCRRDNFREGRVFRG